MKHCYSRYIILVLILTLILAACGTKELSTDEVEKVTLIIGGPKQQEHTTITLQDKKNIKRIFAVEKKLQNYNPKNDFKTWKLDIKIVYHLSDNREIIRLYRGIRPVGDFLKNIYNSQEYKEQTIPLFKLDKGEITKIRFDSYLNGEQDFFTMGYVPFSYLFICCVADLIII